MNNHTRTRKSLTLLAACTMLVAGLMLSGSGPVVPTGTWVGTDSMDQARSGASAVLLADGRVLVIGGADGSALSAGVEAYGLDGVFSPVASMHAARKGAAAALLADGRVLVAGGETIGEGITNSAEVYSPASDSWALVGALNEARSGASATALADGRVVIAGGQGPAGVRSSVEIYDPVSESFSVAGSLSSPRVGHAAAVVGDLPVKGNALQNAKVLFIGGSNGSAALASSDVYDVASGQISAGPALPGPRSGASATSLLGGRVYVAGGSDGSADLSSALIIDSSLNVSPSSAALGTARQGHLAFSLPNNNSVLLVGGTSSGAALSSAELYNPDADSASATGSLAAARSGAAGSALAYPGRLLVAGGSGLSAEVYGFATVSTNKPDYAPGETVIITGTGYAAGETVQLTLVEDPAIHANVVLSAVADAAGNISNSNYSPELHDIGVRFYLYALGQASGYSAKNTFTDAPAADIDQCRTGAASAPSDCNTGAYNLGGGNDTGWVNGNAGSSNAHYTEGFAIGYRVRMDEVPTTQNIDVFLSYDNKHSDHVAIDFLTHYQCLEPHGGFGHAAETISPEDGTVHDSTSPTLFTIPLPSTVNSTAPVGAPDPDGGFNDCVSGGNADGNKMAIWGGTILAIDYTNPNSCPGVPATANMLGTYADGVNQSTTFIRVQIDPSSADVILGWGGHIASRVDWGFFSPTDPRSAGGINGSPYHMRLESWCFAGTNDDVTNLGNQDRSLSAAAVLVPATKRGVKFQDNNNNGVKDGGEPLLADWEIKMFRDNGSVPGAWDATDTLVGSFFTSDGTDVGPSGAVLPLGTYEFQVFQGDYIVCEVLQAGFTQTFPTGNTVCSANAAFGDAGYAITLANNQQDLDNDFGNVALGSLKIIKDADPATGVDFDFDGTGTGIDADFDLDDSATSDTGAVLPDNIVFSDITAGLKTAKENVTSGWQLVNIACTGQVSSTIAFVGANADPAFQPGDNQVNVTLAAGEDVVCTFTNKKEGSIKIVKDSDPANGEDFDFDGTGQGIDADFDLDDSADGNVGAVLPDFILFSGLLEDGVRSAMENVTAGWVLTNIACTGATDSTIAFVGANADPAFQAGDDQVDVTLENGEDIVCTFTNRKEGSIKIVKDADPATGVDFDYDGTGQGIDADFDLDDSADSNVGAVLPDFILFSGLLEDGVRSAKENVTAGWVLTNIACTGATNSTIAFVGANADPAFQAGDNQVNVTLVNGENIVCTFTNRKEGSIKIVKDADPATGVDFDYDGTGQGIDADFDLDDSADSNVGAVLPDFILFSGLLEDGVRSAKENVTAGWQLTNIACTGQVNSTIAFVGANADPAFQAGDNQVNVTLVDGEDIVCTFTNKKEGSIKIVKDADPATGVDFDYDGSGQGIDADFDLDDSADSNVGAVLPDFILFSGLLEDGVRSAKENVTAGWQLTNIACTGATNSTIAFVGANADPAFQAGDNQVNVTLVDGEDIVCTFTNRKEGSIKIVKDADPATGVDFDYDGSGQGISADFDLDDSADSNVGAVLPDFILFSGLLENGVRSAKENVTAGWQLTNIACTGQVNSTIAFVGANADPAFQAGDNQVNVTLVDGEDIVCTFTNRKEGSIKIVKDSIPANGADFDFDGTGQGIDADFDLDDSADSNVGAVLPDFILFSGLLENGVRSAKENVTANWNLTNIVCTGAVNSTIVISGDGADPGFQVGDNLVEITLRDGEDIVCTFTNRRPEARIKIQGTDTNEIGVEHCFDVTIEKDPEGDGTFVNAVTADLTALGFTLLSSNGAACVLNAANSTCDDDTLSSGQCQICFVSATRGQCKSNASATLLIGDVSITRDTDPATAGVGAGPGGIEGPAVKTYVGARISITPETDANVVGSNHTLTAKVEIGDGVADNASEPDAVQANLLDDLEPAPNGTLVECTIVSGPGSFVGLDDDCLTAGNDGTGNVGGTCTVAITSAVVGTTEVECHTTVTVSGVPLFRQTGTAGNGSNAEKDWVANSIKIIKNAIPDAPANFPFDAIGDGVADFTLDDDGLGGGDLACTDGNCLMMITFDELSDGLRQITETPVPANWFISNIVCTGATDTVITIGVFGDDPSFDGNFDSGDNSVKIDLSAHSNAGLVGENIVCTFTNTKPEARIKIEGNGTNEIGDEHCFVVTVEKDPEVDGSFVPAVTADLTALDFTLLSSNGANCLLNAANSTCDDDVLDGSGQCDICFVSATRGQCKSNASATLLLGGVSLTRDTDPATAGVGAGPGGIEGPVTKTYVGARVLLSPLEDTNGVGNDHVLTVEVDIGDGIPDDPGEPPDQFFDAPDGTPVSCTIVSGPGSFVDDGMDVAEGSGGFEADTMEGNDCLIVSGSCQITITSEELGTTEINCTTQVEVGGVVLNRGTTGSAPNSPNAIKVWVGNSLKIIKDAIPDAPADFPYDALGAGVADFTLDDDGLPGGNLACTDGNCLMMITFDELENGLRQITETPVPAAWFISNIQCSGATLSTVTIGIFGNDASFGAVFEDGDNSVKVNLVAGQEAGENVVCTFTNKKRGSIKIVKDATPNAHQDFEFDPSVNLAGANFFLDDNAGLPDPDPGVDRDMMITFPNLLPSAFDAIGSYVVAEIPVTDWLLTSIVCVNADTGGAATSVISFSGNGGVDTAAFEEGDTTVTIQLAIGENVQCTFNNFLVGMEGCTPGYWKNHIDRWEGFTFDQLLSSVWPFLLGPTADPADDPFGTEISGATLHQALMFPGGSGKEGAARILLRAAVAALLNSAHSGVDYSLSTAQVISMVNQALMDAAAESDVTVARSILLTLAGTLDEENNAGCPLGGSRANRGVTEDGTNTSSGPPPNRNRTESEGDGGSTGSAMLFSNTPLFGATSQPVASQPTAEPATTTASASADTGSVAGVPPVLTAMWLPETSEVEFSGVLRDASGQPLTGVVGLTFALYQEQEGGAPLWLDTQNVELDAQGRYTVRLAAPLDLHARWVGILAQGVPEQPRVPVQ